MVHGSFDDRDDARLHVKQWLRSNSVSEYTTHNLRRLAHDLMKSDSDPVDHIRIAWRERGYGIVKGLVEFAAEELSLPGDGFPEYQNRAHDELSKAADLLPNRVGPAVEHLKVALDYLTSGAQPARNQMERASVAVSVALSMLGGTRVSAAA